MTEWLKKQFLKKFLNSLMRSLWSVLVWLYSKNFLCIVLSFIIHMYLCLFLLERSLEGQEITNTAFCYLAPHCFYQIYTFFNMYLFLCFFNNIDNFVTNVYDFSNKHYLSIYSYFLWNHKGCKNFKTFPFSAFLLLCGMQNYTSRWIFSNMIYKH